jgi:Recombination directionality factor-like
VSAGELARQDAPPPARRLTGAPAAGLLLALADEPSWDESGRIRLGYSEQVEGRRGKQPHKLEHYRLTSHDDEMLALAAGLYGGQVEPWEDAPEGPQWQLFTEADWLPVIVPPRAAITQGWEAWDKPPGQKRAPQIAVRRCDGTREQRTDGPCLCAAEQAAADQAGRPYEPPCALHTRLSVLLHELPDFGVWRLDTTGEVAARQLATFLRHFYPGLPPFTKLQLGIRTARRRKQLPSGAWQLVSFPVPRLRPDPRLGLTVGDLLDAARDGPGELVAELADAAQDAQEATETTEAAVEEAAGPAVTRFGGQAPESGEGPAPPADPGPGAPPPPPPPPPAAGLGPVTRWCVQRNLAVGTARLFLVRGHPDTYGPDGPLPLPNTNALNALGGDPDDPTSPAGATIKLLAAQFTEVGEPAGWGDDPGPDTPPPPAEPTQGRLGGDP